MRRILYILATIGYMGCFVEAMLPNLCIGRPFRTWALMAGFALVAAVCGEGAQRGFPILALVVGLAGSINAYRVNSRVIEGMRRNWRQHEMMRRESVQQVETNGSAEVQTNHLSEPEPKLSPFNCCP